MGVSVDESREHQFVFGVDCLRGRVPGFDFGAWADCDNRVAGHCDCSVVVDGTLAVHRDYDAAGDDQVGFLFRLGRKKNCEEKLEST